MKAIHLTFALVLAATAAEAKDGADANFVSKAGEAGLAEVALGNDAIMQGNSEDVKQFASRMVTDHSSANEKLKSAASAGGFTVPSEPSADQKATETKLKGMQGAAFDKAYVAQMVNDHNDAVALFETESKSGQDAALKTFASETLPTLKDHLRMAESLKTGAKK